MTVAAFVNCTWSGLHGPGSVSQCRTRAFPSRKNIISNSKTLRIPSKSPPHRGVKQSTHPWTASANQSAPSRAHVPKHDVDPPLTPVRTLLLTLAAFLIGACGAAFGSLIGAGGAVVMTPLLTFALSITQRRAHGTSLCIVAVTSLIGARKYYFAQQVALTAAALLTSMAVVTAPVGAKLAARLDSKVLKKYFGFFLVFISLLIPTAPHLLRNTPGTILSVHAQRFVLVVVGALSGFLSGLLGIGGGTLMVPALVLLAGLPQKLAQGTALLAMLVPSILGASTHLLLRNVVRILLPGLAAGAVLGGSAGSALALALSEQTLRVVCSMLFCAIGLRYILQSWQKSPKVDVSGSRSNND